MKGKILLGLILLVLLVGFLCGQYLKEGKAMSVVQENRLASAIKTEEFAALSYVERAPILAKLKEKKRSGDALHVHVFVPLCDNKNQGIVPVPKALGNGFQPESNLYWGAAYGIHTYFKRHADWKLVKRQRVISESVLERVIYYNKLKNCYLTADAYRGDRMAACLTDFLGALGGMEYKHFSREKNDLVLYGEADLLVFNGHNGLMDTEVSLSGNADGKQREAAVIACASYSYFEQAFSRAQAYPLFTTTNLLAPEAYVLERVVSNWAEAKTGEAILNAGATAYNKYQKCGINGARRLFQTGWTVD